MRSRQNFLYRLLDKDYYDTFDAYMPRKADFYDYVASLLPPNWSIQKKAIWFHCGSPENATPTQGWKIHISATPDNAREVLSRVVSILFKRMDADFKFALDLSTVFLLNGKNWSRGGSGKFITIYPRDNAQFIELIEQIHLSTTDLRGPYVLSDHRYKDSGSVFYRYGGMRHFDVLNVNGERTPMLTAPDGSHFPDRRQPYPVTPSWASKLFPIEDQQEQSTPSHFLRQGRYEIQDALSFSNAGGVYVAVDRTSGKRVVIKEARPCVNPTPNGYDAVRLLQKEYRLLGVIAYAGIAPRPIDLFTEWEHWFLVEEFIEGLTLASHSASHNILLRTRPAPEDFHLWQKTFLSVCSKLITALEVLHRHNIVFSDLSTNNVLMEPEGDLKLIDFEGAYEVGVDLPTALYTPGFVSQNRLMGDEAAKADDYYAAGALLMAYLFPITAFFHLNPGAHKNIMGPIQNDARLPESVGGMIVALMSPDPASRPLAPQIRTVLERCAGEAAARKQPEQYTADYRSIIEGIVSHLNHVATFSRHDRLFPSDQKLFVTNPLNIAWGAAGVGYALHRVTAQSHENVAAWILRHPINSELYTPGLYAGMSGVAWALLEMGNTEEAEDIFQRTYDHKLLSDSPDIFYGIAGWGMACLRFFLATGNECYLSKARQAGEQLLRTCRHSGDLCFWSDSENAPLGFAHGASGIALFLLYLHLATQEEEFLTTGRRGLEFDLRHAVVTKDLGFSWKSSSRGNSPVYPYWQNGSSGIGTSVLRYWRLLGGDHYWSVLEKIFVDVDRKYAVLPGRFMGSTGLGDFLLDMYEVSGQSRFLRSAQRIAEGILQFQVERCGIAFPGDSISRLSSSYGNGSAGIALFLNRLSGQKGNHFMLDCLFETTKSGAMSPLHEEQFMPATLLRGTIQSEVRLGAG